MLDPVYAVELEPGRYFITTRGGPYLCKYPESAEREARWFRTEAQPIRPNARVVRFKLVREDEDAG